MDQSLMEERKADYQVYEAAGSHFEIGLCTARRGGSLIGGGKDMSASQKAYAERCRTLVSRYYPEIVEEYEGYASALSIPEDDLLWHYTLGVNGCCSGIAVLTPEGMRTGRNYDYYYFENRRHLLLTRPHQGYAHIGMHEGLVGGRFDGMNEKGLFVSFNGAGPHPDPGVPGMSFHLIVRYLLEKCADVREAEEALLRLPVKESKSYLVADRSDAFVAEVHPERKRIRRMEEGCLVMTNHFLHPDMEAYQKAWPNSLARYKKILHSALRLTTSGVDSWEGLRRCLSDHEAPVCGHTDGLATFWSCVADLETRDIRYSLGAPCRNEYRPYLAFTERAQQ